MTALEKLLYYRRVEKNGDIYTIQRAMAPSPLILNIPHSGRAYPQDFQTVCDPALLTGAEDNEVDLLFDGSGATTVTAQFPRTYIDANRAVTDIDAALLDGKWRGEVKPERSRTGLGLIRRLLRPGVRLYDRKLRPDEVRQRIETYYVPYHAALETVLSEAQARFGVVWLLDAHSMPGRQAADFVLGDRNGKSCAPAFTDFVAGWLLERGYEVAINTPYSGVEILRRYGKPKEGRHALQLEINKRLYWDEVKQERTVKFAKLAAVMRDLVSAISDFTQTEMEARAAE